VVVAHHLPQTTTLRTSSLDCRVVSTHRRAESTHSLDRQCRHRRFGALHLAEDVRRIHSDHARCPIGENDDEPKFTISSLKRHGNQPLTAKRMRRRDNCYLCRQPLAKLLQSVAVTVGAGKSVAVRAAVAGLDRTRYTVVYLANPSGGCRGLYVAITTALGATPRFHKAEAITQVANLLAAEQAERHRKVVFLIDEAHLLSPEQLEELRLLSNAEMDSASPFAGLLIGQPTLATRLRQGIFAALDQRISVRYAIGGMDLAESVGYLRHHLELAGRTDQLIADDAAARLHRYANGIPRALNNAATAGLMAAAADGKGLVDDVCAKKAVAELTRT
jgi:type II secretory pathway predicted ATPase ExeA